MRIGRYEVGDSLGSGGMAEVFRATGPDGAAVALKVLRETFPDVVRRFRDEGRIQARLDHPNVVRVHEVIESATGPVLVLDLVDGPDLESVLSTGVPLPADEAEMLFRRVLSAIGHAHAHGVVHRDLKPANILLDGPLQVPRVTDFGVARITEDAGSLVDPARPRTTGFLGTPGYAAPEQAMSPETVDRRVDVFALGALLYELLSGAPAFPGGPMAALVAASERAYIPLDERVPDLPPHLVALVNACLAPRAADRLPDAQAIRERLDRIPPPTPSAGSWIDGPPALDLPPGREPERDAVLAAVAAGARWVSLVGPSSADPSGLADAVAEEFGRAQGVAVVQTADRVDGPAVIRVDLAGPLPEVHPDRLVVASGAAAAGLPAEHVVRVWPLPVGLAGTTLEPEHLVDGDDTFLSSWEDGAPADTPATDARPAPPSSRYTLEDRLGRGGMGEVWRAHDAVLRRHVALKVIRPGRVRSDMIVRFRQEAQVTGQLEHPNIVPVHDLGSLPDGSLYFTMKVVHGRSLTEWIDDAWGALDSGELTHGEVLVAFAGVFERVCEALAFAHDRGVVHRDLKPDNVMVGEFGEVQVMDWGLARLVASAELPAAVRSDRGDSAHETRMGAIAGTPAYMAPEQARGDTDAIGPAADIWALGAILFRAVAGAPAFSGEPESILIEVARGPTLVPAHHARQPLPKELDAIVRRAMAPDISGRYAGVGAMLTDLRAWRDGRPLERLDYTPGERIAMWARRNRRSVRAAGLTAAVAGAVLSVGLVRYVADIQAAHALAEERADAALLAEEDARLRLAQAQVATGDALVATARFGEARESYADAKALLAELDRTTLAAELGLWRTVNASRPPLAELPGTLLGAGPDERSLLIQRGDRVVQVAVPLTRTIAEWPAPPGRIGTVHREDGALIAYSGHGDQLWRTQLGGEPVPIADLADRYHHSIHAADDGRWVMASDQDGTLAIQIVHHSDAWVADDLTARGVSPPSGGLAVLTRFAASTELWDLDAGQRLRELTPKYARGTIDHAGDVVALEVEREDVLRAEAVESGRVLWEVEQRNETPIGITPDDRGLLTRSIDGNGALRDLADGHVVLRFDGQGDRFERHAITSELVAAQVEGRESVQLWSHAGGPTGVLAAGEASDLDLAGGLFAVGVGPRLVIWDAVSGLELCGWDLPFAPERVAWSEDGRSVGATASGSVVAVHVDVVAGTLREVPVQLKSSAVAVAGEALFVGYRDGHISRVDASGLGWTRPGAGPEDNGVWDLSAADGELVASTWRPGRIDRIATATGATLGTWDAGGWSYSFDVHDQRLAVGTYADDARVWDLDGTLLATLGPHAGPVLQVAFSPDGRYLATGDYGSQLRLWDLEAGGAPVSVDQAHVSTVGVVYWADDGALLSAGDRLLRRDLSVAPDLAAAPVHLATLAAGGDLDASAQAQLGRALAANGLHADAAALLDAADATPMDRMRAWFYAGDRPKAEAALAELQASEVVRTVWSRAIAAL
ncbi:MAG: serine/threonine protein kinase [Myxococcota bacterium]